jgi:YVTN family beta-propeller protein
LLGAASLPPWISPHDTELIPAALAAAVGLPVLLAGPTRGKVLADGVGEVTSAGGIARNVALPGRPGAAVAADGSVWVTSPEGNVVYRIDPVTATVVQTIPVGAGPSAITAAGPDIWVANTLDGTISRISAAADRVVQVVAVGAEPTGITAGGGSIWVADSSASTLSALNPASGQLTATIPLASPPFGVAYGAGSVWVTSPAGNSVTRVDPRPTAASFLEGMVGAAACAPGKLCDLARGVTADDSARTVTFRLTAPDPYFLDKLAFEFTAPVPPNIPARDVGRDPVPGTGPYMITRYIPVARSSSPATRSSGNGRPPPSRKGPPIASSGPSARRSPARRPRSRPGRPTGPTTRCPAWPG